MVRVRPTTLEDCEQLLGGKPAWRIRAMTADVDGAPVAIGGLAYLPDNTVFAFLEGAEAVKRHPVAIHKAVRRGLDDAKRRGVRRILSIADEHIEAAPRWLERFGFVAAGHDNLFTLEL
jgi:hypothetical protein